MTAQGISSTSSTLTIVSTSTLAPAISSTDAIAGKWSGSSPTLLELFRHRSSCRSRAVASQARFAEHSTLHNFPAPAIFPPSGQRRNLFVYGARYDGAASCTSGGYEQLQSQADETLSYEYLTSPGATAASTGVLKHP